LDRVPWTFDRTGSHVALDLANTLSGRKAGTLREHLVDWQRVVDFVEQVGAADPIEVARLRTIEDEAATEAVRRLREALYDVFLAIAEGRRPPEDGIAELNRWMRQFELTPDLTWQCAEDCRGPQAALMPVVRAGIDLLLSPDRDRVRQCGADDCAWLFLDLSKNRSRQWCDMASCGNRAKAKRFRAKSREG
jgi:predicted RNA-binding Zn ribbon-like protein